MVLDKLDLLQALEFGSDLTQIKASYTYRCIITTTDMRSDDVKPTEEVEEFKQIKSYFMGSGKGLVIKLD